ncbi:alpha/beta fold hydrolase [Rhizobium lusitanum]|nr:alpha/beta fold hydrolase [Rhizobium lusitanum]
MTAHGIMRREEQPPLVLVPGTACDERIFKPMLDRLKYPHTITLEIDGVSSMHDAALRILSKAPERFILCGFSLGGIAAFEIVAQASERVEKLVLIDTTAKPDPIENTAVRRKAVAEAEARGMESFILDAWPKLVAPCNIYDHEIRSTIVAMANDCGVAKLAAQAEVAISRADSRPRLGAITQPTLVLAGESEAVCPIDAHREIADGISGAELVVIPKAGHFSPLENPAEISAQLKRFLAR